MTEIRVPSDLTLEEYQALYPQKGHKYHAVATVVDGHRFPSKREAARYLELKMMQKAGEIRDLDLQPRYPIVINGVKVCTYIADFRYVDVAKGLQIVEDSKGVRTEGYRIKRKLVLAVHGIEITEV